MKSFEQVLKEFRSSKVIITNDQLEMLVDELQFVTNVLVNKGDLFRSAYLFALNELDRVKDTLYERKL